MAYLGKGRLSTIMPSDCEMGRLGTLELTAFGKIPFS